MVLLFLFNEQSRADNRKGGTKHRGRLTARQVDVGDPGNKVLSYKAPVVIIPNQNNIKKPLEKEPDVVQKKIEPEKKEVKIPVDEKKMLLMCLKNIRIYIWFQWKIKLKT